MLKIIRTSLNSHLVSVIFLTKMKHQKVNQIFSTPDQNIEIVIFENNSKMSHGFWTFLF